jgi:hypothetical protein
MNSNTFMSISVGFSPLRKADSYSVFSIWSAVGSALCFGLLIFLVLVTGLRKT